MEILPKVVKITLGLIETHIFDKVYPHWVDRLTTNPLGWAIKYWMAKAWLGECYWKNKIIWRHTKWWDDSTNNKLNNQT
jgi:hypothetical protein